MPHVFISYARATEHDACAIADALRELGHEVWRDDQLPAHRPYGEVIAERLAASAAVVVVWSAEACRSHWVLAEADAARAAGTLVQASLDGVLPPMPFNQIQCADLQGWAGEKSHPGWRKVADSVAALAEGRPHDASPIPPAREPRRLCICVLPFANMSGDAEQEYFSDGISEDIITDLGKVSTLSVIARNTAFTFKGRAVDVVEVGRRLGVSHLLEGSVRKAGSRVRITAQLIDAVRGEQLWAERWDRDLHDIFALQDEISRAVVASLRLKLLPAEKEAMQTRDTRSAEAYDLYLNARQHWTSGNDGSRARDERIISLCRRAVAIDPGYARAWALLALAQSELRDRHGADEEDGEEATERALALDPALAEAHAVRARVLAGRGDFDRADAAAAEALRLDGQSWEVRNAAARLAFRRGRLAEAVEHFEKAAALVGTDNQSTGFLVVCYTALGDRTAAAGAARRTIGRAEQALREDRSNGAALAHAAYSFACLGDAQSARDWARRALLVDPDNNTMRYNLACMFTTQLDDTNGALELLESYAAEASPAHIRHMDVDPDMDRVRGHPRFQAMSAAAKARLGIA